MAQLLLCFGACKRCMTFIQQRMLCFCLLYNFMCWRYWALRLAPHRPTSNTHSCENGAVIAFSFDCVLFGSNFCLVEKERDRDDKKNIEGKLCNWTQLEICHSTVVNLQKEHYALNFKHFLFYFEVQKEQRNANLDKNISKQQTSNLGYIEQYTTKKLIINK